MKRLRDALLGMFASIAAEHGLHPIRARGGGDKILGIRGDGGATYPGGDLVIVDKSRVVVVDVGGGGGALSILRCWRHIMASGAPERIPTTLFYVAIVSHGRSDSPARALWDFVTDKARDAVGGAIVLHYASCTRPPLVLSQDIPASALDRCRVELDAQGMLAAFRQWFTKESPGT